jgi:hypothetical protein
MNDTAMGHSRAGVLAACMSPASYWVPNFISPESTWMAHAPFGFWLIDALRPKSIVELGSQTGYSYFVFCQAVKALSLDCRCYAIGDWGAGLFEQAEKHNATHYGSFSRLTRSEPARAADTFEGQSVDLLHLDKTLSYDAAASALERWRSRLGKSGIVLMDGTNAASTDGGIARLWREVSKDHRHFEFLHADGLGIVEIGGKVAALDDLFRYVLGEEAAHQLRSAYSRLGLAIADRVEREALEARLRAAEAECARVSKIESESVASVERIKLELAQQSKLLAYVSAVVAQKQVERDQVVRDYETLVNSRSWRITKPLRMVYRTRTLVRGVMDRLRHISVSG